MSWEVIHAYTRAEAIQDGALIEEPISGLAREYGIRFPCVMTSALFTELEPTAKDVGQDLTGRIWDMLTIFRLHARQGGSEIRHWFWVRRGRRMTRQEVKVICGPGDHDEPVITFMLPEED